MKNNKISKITMIGSLLVTGIVNAQEFYTCVPNDDWVKNLVKETIKKTQWKKIIHLTPASNLSEFKQTLPAGKYRVIASGAGGSEQIREFTLNSSYEFKACVGQAGEDNKNSNGGAGGGGLGYDGIYCGGGGGGGVGFGGGDDRGGGTRCLNIRVYNGGYRTNGKDGTQKSDLADNNVKLFCGGGGGDNNGFRGGKGYGNYGGKGGVGYSESGGGGGGGGGYLGEGGRGGSANSDETGFGLGGKGCYGGGGGAGGSRSWLVGGGGGGGGSYFEIGDIKLILKGGDGSLGHFLEAGSGNGAGPDGYMIIERWE